MSRHALRFTGRKHGWARAATVVALTAILCASGWVGVGPRAEEPHWPMTPLTAPDLINPQRGQFANIGTELFPQANPAQARYPDWPGTRDAAIRFDWRTLQPRDPRSIPPDAPDTERFDFSKIDEALDVYGNAGIRTALRISSYDSCCEKVYENATNIGVPDWLRELPGSTRSYVHDGVKQIVPEWNHPDYLGHFTELLAALGRRYDLDERLAVFEMSGYGDFSENHVAVLRDHLGAPGPAPEDSEAALGYYSQYADQTLTQRAAEQLVSANLRAFPHTRIVTAAGNPAITKLLLRDSPELAVVDHLVGLRSDCLGVYGVVPTWAVNPYSKYVERADPIIGDLLDRYAVAPVLTEWCRKPSDVKAEDYYTFALREVVSNHVSLVASTGFPDQLPDEPMPPALYEGLARTFTLSGYRYAAHGRTLGPGELEVTWKNLGSAATHDRWKANFTVRDESGAAVGVVPAKTSLNNLVATRTAGNDRETPIPAVTTERIVFPTTNLKPGRYTVVVTVEWDEHKPSATHTVNYPPMQLAMSGRGPDGSYRVGEFDIG
ncbi:hypothetical protein [Rhodococcus sp. NPDC058521]|uniref:hypothetical protein n=1 Tax=Rhodococcus sp. NPDC058521 TaxID=3346536 RepID=UPI003669574B